MSFSCTVDSQAIYEIRVKGHLDKRWLTRFESFQIHCQCNGDSLLCGPVADQAALFGLLDYIRNMGVPLLSVNRRELDDRATTRCK